MLVRNIRIEEDLVDQLFNSSEKRLARTLLLLARYGKEDTTERTLPKLSQETLAEMIGTTRSRVNFFMNKFRKLGLHRVQRQPQDQQLAAQHRPPRVTRSAGAGRWPPPACVRPPPQPEVSEPLASPTASRNTKICGRVGTAAVMTSVYGSSRNIRSRPWRGW